MSAQVVALTTPSFGHLKMDDRKRPADADDLSAPPAKRHASTANGEESNDIKFGPLQSPWQVDLESFQKDAILRQMKEYKRDKGLLEQQLADVEKRAETFDSRLLIIDSWLQQLGDELTLLVAGFKSVDAPTRSQDDAAYLSQLLKSDTKMFKSLVDDRFTRLKQLFTTVVARVPEASPEVRELQIEISRLLASEREHVTRATRLEAQFKEADQKCEDYQYKWSIAKAQLAKAQSKASQYMEMQNKRRSSNDQSETITKQSNGETVNGVAPLEANGVASEEAESGKRAALAEVEKRKQQIEELEAENKKINEQLTSTTTRLNNLSDDDYAQTHLFKTLRSQHEDIIKRVNDLEAKNVQLREEAQKLQAERTAYRNEVEEDSRVKCEEAEASIARVELDIARVRSERDLAHQQRVLVEGNQFKHDAAMKELQALAAANDTQMEAVASEVKRLKTALKEIQPEGVSEDDLAEQSQEDLRKEVISLRAQLSALNMELASMQTAVTKFKTAATKKVQDFVALEQEVQRLKEAKHRLDSNRFSEKTILDARRTECDNMRKQSSKSGEIIAQLKESENKTRDLCANWEKQVAEYKAQVEPLSDQVSVLTRKVASLNDATAAHELQVATWKTALAAKDVDLATAQHAQRNAEAENASLKSKLSDAKKKADDWKNKNRSDPTDEVQMLRTVAYCNTCNSNLKDTLIKSCGHILCSECAKSRIQNRQRKCPVCMKAFGTGDLQAVHLV